MCHSPLTHPQSRLERLNTTHAERDNGIRERRALSGSEPTGGKPARPAGTRSSSIRAQAWHVPLPLAQHTTALPSVAKSTGARAHSRALQALKPANMHLLDHRPPQPRPPPSAPPRAARMRRRLLGVLRYALRAALTIISQPMFCSTATPRRFTCRRGSSRCANGLGTCGSAARSQRATQYSRRPHGAVVGGLPRPIALHRIAWRRNVLCRTVWQRRRRLSRTSTAPCLRWPLL